MADDNQVEIRFSASTDDALAGIARLQGSLVKLGAPITNLKGIFAQLRAAFTAATPAGMVAEAANAFGELGSKAASTALQMRNIGAEIGLLHQGLAQQKTVLDAEASQYQITRNKKKRNTGPN